MVSTELTLLAAMQILSIKATLRFITPTMILIGFVVHPLKQQTQLRSLACSCLYVHVSAMASPVCQK